MIFRATQYFNNQPTIIASREFQRTTKIMCAFCVLGQVHSAQINNNGLHVCSEYLYLPFS